MSLFSSLEHKVAHELSHLASSAKSDISKLGGQAKHDLEKLAAEAKADFDKAAHSAALEVEHLGKQAAQDLQQAATVAEETVATALHKALEAALQAVSAGALHKAATIAATLEPGQMTLALGPVELGLDDIADRLSVLHRWAANPPAVHTHIKEMVLELSPSWVTVHLDIQLAAVLVTTDDLSLGFSATWDADDFVRHFDDIMQAF